MSYSLYPTKESVLKRALELVDAEVSFGLLDKKGRLSDKNKGDLGQIIEETWFGNSPHSDKDPDFVEAGVELKVSPYKKTKNGYSAKERLVCDIINYEEEVGKSFEESAFWHKCRCICLLYYQWLEGVPKGELFVDHAFLLNSYPDEDLLIIKNDWNTIVEKIRAGKAHELSEGDTMYLAACTKGATSESVKRQPFSSVPAKQRAYSLKTSYMTQLLRKYVFGKGEDEHIVKDYKLLEKKSFDEIVIDMFAPYIGMSTLQIARSLGIAVNDKNAKNLNAVLIRRLLGIIGDPNRATEFQNANITVKTIVVNSIDMPEQNMSFPEFSFLEICEQEWVDSDVYDQIAAARFLFVVFQRDQKTEEPVLKDVFFWNMPNDDIDELQRVWEKTRDEIKSGVELFINNGKVYNSLPNQSESYLSHVRPHTSKRGYLFEDGTVIGDKNDEGYPKYGNPLPDGRWMTKQSFWLNKEYIQTVIRKHISSFSGSNSLKVADKASHLSNIITRK